MRILLHPSERRPDPEPLRTDDRKAVLVGIGVWLVLGALALLRRDELEAAGRGWWLWCCVWGLFLGVAGLAYLHRRRTPNRDQARRSDPVRSDPVSSDPVNPAPARPEPTTRRPDRP